MKQEKINQDVAYGKVEPWNSRLWHKLLPLGGGAKGGMRGAAVSP